MINVHPDMIDTEWEAKKHLIPDTIAEIKLFEYWQKGKPIIKDGMYPPMEHLLEWDRLKKGFELVDITDEYAWEFIKSLLEGLCSNCGEAISDGDIVCEDCYQQAKNMRVYGPIV